MTVVESKLKSNFWKIKEFQQLFSNDKEDNENSIKRLNVFLEEIINTFSHNNINELWYVKKNTSQSINSSISFLELLIPKIDLDHKNISNKLDIDSVINIGLFIDRMKKIVSILKYVQMGSVPSNEYNVLSWEDKIRSFAILEDNWDGEDAISVSKTRILASIKFLNNFKKYQDNLKMVYPSFIGSVGLIYQLEDYNINILFITKEKIEVVVHQSKSLLTKKEIDIVSIKSFEQFFS